MIVAHWAKALRSDLLKRKRCSFLKAPASVARFLWLSGWRPNKGGPRAPAKPFLPAPENKLMRSPVLSTEPNPQALSTHCWPQWRQATLAVRSCRPVLPRPEPCVIEDAHSAASPNMRIYVCLPISISELKSDLLL